MFERARYTIELLRAGYSREEIAELLAPEPEAPPAGELETIRAEIDELRRNQQAQHIREANAPMEDDPETAIIKHFSK